VYEYELISQTVIDGDAEKVIKLTQKAIHEGYPAENILEKGLIHGMNLIAEKFRHEKVMIPEVLMSTRAMHAGMMTINPYLNKSRSSKEPKVLIGTVAGDLHDIGKNLVILILASIGVEVVDLGIDVSAKKFLQAIRKEKPEYLMMSALLTTTMPAMREVIEAIEKGGLRSQVKVVIGGGPVTGVFANEIGADFYFEDAFKVRQYFLESSRKKG
jgi:5-methyltetrahydrofolate--homocysteine methyltransferase